MSTGQILLIVVSGLGVIHGLFLALFLWFYRQGSRVSNRILSLLLVVLSFRVGKSVFLEFAADLDVKLIFTGLGTLMMIGPLFYFYCRSCVLKEFRFKRSYLVHFVPSLLGICLGLWLEESHLESLPMVFFLILFLSYYSHYLVYLLVSYSFIKRRKGTLSEGTSTLLHLLFYGLLVIWVAYVLNLFDELIPYIVGPVLYSVVAYVISFIVISKGYVQQVNKTKYKTTSVSDTQMDQVYEKVQHLMAEEKLFRDSGITLQSISSTLNVTPQVLSMVINERSERNFNGFVNQFRVNESLELLDDPGYQNFTIAAIAVEVGFNSLSSFNKSFKEQVGQTPLAYRQRLMK